MPQLWNIDALHLNKYHIFRFYIKFYLSSKTPVSIDDRGSRKKNQFEGVTL